ncbi:MAG: beta-propeller fold lactonase family protein, partial [Chthoniobacterales bacterium]
MSRKTPVARFALLFALAVCSLSLAEKSHAAGRVFVANTLSSSVSVIDDATGALIATIPVGVRPIRIVASQDGRKAYTSNFVGGTVSVIDTVNLVVTATIPVPSSPQESDISIDGTRLFVVHHTEQLVSVIDLATNSVVNVISIGDPHQGTPGRTATDITFSPNGHYAYVPNYSRNVLDTIDTETYAVTEIPTGAQPRRVAVSPNGKRVFVANFEGDSVTAADVRRLQVLGTIPSGDAARG